MGGKRSGSCLRIVAAASVASRTVSVALLRDCLCHLQRRIDERTRLQCAGVILVLLRVIAAPSVAARTILSIANLGTTYATCRAGAPMHLEAVECAFVSSSSIGLCLPKLTPSVKAAAAQDYAN